MKTIFISIFQFIQSRNWLIVTFLFIAVELLIQPVGEFPLNDDWAYSKSVEAYVKFGKVEFSDMLAIPFISQYLVGVSVAKIIGFSFFGLRMISIVSTIMMIFVFSRILLLLKVKKGISLFVLLIFTFNPLVLYLGNTFLPDTFILLNAMISIYFFIKIMNIEVKWNLLLFIVFTLIGTLNRQTGILIPLFFSIIYFISNSKTFRNSCIAIIPLFINFFALFLYEYSLTKWNLLPGNYNLQLNRILTVLSHPTFLDLQTISFYFITSSICLGLFILPLTISNIKKHFCEFQQFILLKIGVIGYLLIVFGKILFSNNSFPFVGNILHSSGIGPVILTGYNSDRIYEISLLIKGLFIFLTLLGGISFVFSFCSILLKLGLSLKLKMEWFSLFFIFLFLGYLTPICFNYANDRYLLFLFPFYCIAYVKSVGIEVKIRLFSIVFIPLFIFSFVGVSDYFSLNNARWKGLNHLTNELKVSPEKIDGGFEFNAWYFADEKDNNYIPTHEGRWWWIQKDTFIISPIKRKGYTIESSYNFNSYCTFPFERLFVLEKIKK